MSVNVEAMAHKRAACYTADGTLYTGTLEAIDGNFHVVLGQCTRDGDAGNTRLAHSAAGEDGSHGGGDGSKRNDATTTAVVAADADVVPLLFVRGDDVVYVSFDELPA